MRPCTRRRRRERLIRKFIHLLNENYIYLIKINTSYFFFDEEDNFLAFGCNCRLLCKRYER